MHYIYILYLALPCFVANVMPVIAAKFDWCPRLNRPIDGGRKIFGKRIFGDHKTWRGFVVGILGAIIVAIIQYVIFIFGIVGITNVNFFWLFIAFGFLSGFGALLGDSLESAWKRQLDIGSGKSLFPFDQIDYIIGFLVLSSILINWRWSDVVFLLIFSACIAPIVSLIGYLTRIKKIH